MKLRNKKTGEIVEYSKIGFYKPTSSGSETFSPFCDSLTELNDEWEDYASQEPLIKDEQIREIIRAWTKVNDSLVLKYNYDENSLDDIYRNTITFNMGLGLEDGRKYTIPELCGTPDPIEPTFVDLDERIKEKEEE